MYHHPCRQTPTEEKELANANPWKGMGSVPGVQLSASCRRLCMPEKDVEASQNKEMVQEESTIQEVTDLLKQALDEVFAKVCSGACADPVEHAHDLEGRNIEPGHVRQCPRCVA
jgi:hypothetical protein